jgi:7-cyano-7-deazaguanine synthase in queuosine biosynthesis
VTSPPVASTRSYEFNTRGTGEVLLRGTNYSLNDSHLAAVMTDLMSARLADLIDIALAVYVADRRTSRPQGRALATGATWARRFDVTLGVREPAFWSDHANQARLAELLTWLTDDEWSLHFLPIAARQFSSELNAHLTLDFSERASHVALFSGGLDSLAGAAWSLLSGDAPLLVSIETNSRMASVQRELSRRLRSNNPGLCHLPIALQLHDRDDSEPSQRGRAFLFLVLAGAVAIGSGLGRVSVYENGVGAISLPFVPVQEGAHTTRAMHPRTLRATAELVSIVADRNIEIRNPSIWSTKGQLCSRVPREIWPLMSLSESCDNVFAYRGNEMPRCGMCTSCLLRRQALWAAGLSAVDRQQSVRIDLTDPGRSEDRGVTSQLRAMLDQAARLDSALRQDDPWSALSFNYPELLAFATDESDRKEIVNLYATYVDEWRKFPSPMVKRFLPELEPGESHTWGGCHV